MAVPTAYAPQFTVSTQNGGTQQQTAAATLADGRTVVVWQDFASNSGDIKYRLFNADGSAAGAEVTVNVNKTGAQEGPVVTALTGGGFAIAWDTSAGADAPDVAYRVFNAAGGAVTSELLATGSGVQRGATIEATLSGGFVIGYWDGNTANTGLPSNSGAMARAYSALGVGLGSGASLISGNLGGDFAPVFSIGTQGSAVIWDDDLGPNSPANGQDGLYGHTYTGTLPAADTSGGTKINGGPDSEAPRNPDVAMVGANAVFVWEDKYAATTAYDIMMRLGGTVSKVNTTIAGDQVNAHVAALANGLGFVVVWDDQGGVGGSDIRARVYNASGVATSADFVVTGAGAQTNGYQYDANVTALNDGRFMVTWSDDANSDGIQARIFDPRTSGIVWTGKATGEQYEGTAFTDSMNGAGGNDRLGGGAASDTMHGGTGNDRLNGGTQADSMFGEDGNDIYFVDNAADTTTESNASLAVGGNDTVYSSVSRTLGANLENLILTGSAATGTGNGLANAITGNALANTLSGLVGADTLTGGGGRDTLTGGANKDLFDYNAISDSGTTAVTRDLILDFVKGQDKIDLQTFDWNPGGLDDHFSLILAMGTSSSAVASGKIGWYQVNVANAADDRTFLRINADLDAAVDMVIELKGLINIAVGDFYF